MSLSRWMHEVVGRRAPFLRWSVVRMVFGMRHLLTNWQVGDGREEALLRHVTSRVPPGDLNGAIRAIDDFAYNQSFLMNVGDEKGALLDEAVRRTAPRRLLELGTYCGYSALRLARAAPAGTHIYSIEFSAANAAIARRIWEHAGVTERVTVVVGSLGDGGGTLERLRREHGFVHGSLDFLFLDHAKEAYLPDLQRILGEGWLHPGSVVVADNVKVPGAPEYRAYMKEEEGRRWRTREHETHVEYQTLIKDLVLESEYLG